MIVYTMGFSKKSAQTFFELIENNGIDVLVDARINNKSQLAGFTKGSDLAFFLERIARIPYIYEPRFAPTKELLKDWRDGSISWEAYEERFARIMDEGDVATVFDKLCHAYERPVLLCSELTPEHCHRRLLAERFEHDLGKEVVSEVVHL